MNNYWFFNKGMIAVAPENLYNKLFLEELESSYGMDSFNIYLICKIPPLKMEKSQTKIQGNLINIRVTYGNKPFRIEYLVSKEVESAFHENYSLEIESSNDSILFFQHKHSEEKRFSIKIEEFDSHFKIKPEILYIGKSKKVSKRLKLHETFQKILAEKPHSSRLRVYLMGFVTAYGGNSAYAKSDFSSEVADLAFSSKGDLKYKENYSIFESILNQFIILNMLIQIYAKIIG